eukprot:1636159-Pyramimonas_sp.AAC.1
MGAKLCIKDILDGNIVDIFVEDDSLIGLGDHQEPSKEDLAAVQERKRLLAEGLKAATGNLFSSIRGKAESL